MQMKSSFSICVLGDIILDNITYLPEIDINDAELGIDLWFQSKIDTLVGGTAIHIAKAAVDKDYSLVNLIGKIGTNASHNSYDIAGQLIKSYLDGIGISYSLAKDANNSTGSSLMIYFKNNFRFVISNRGANASFEVDDITDEMRDKIRESDILIISGYMLLNNNSAFATLELIHEARKSDTFIALDVVPHRLYTLINKEAFMSYTKQIDLIISNINTIKHFIDVSRLDQDNIESVANELLHSYFGVILSPNIDSFFIIDKSGYKTHDLTGFMNISIEQRRGYLDKLILLYLRPMVERFLKFKNSDGFVS